MSEMSTTMTPAAELAMQRLAETCVDMLSGMIEARIELGMSDEEILPSVVASLTHLFR